MTIHSINPANQQLLKAFAYHTEEELESRLSQADKAYRAWRQTSFAERSALMLRCAGILETEARHYAETITLEMGQPIQQAVAEVKKCATACRYYAGLAEAFLSDRCRPVHPDCQ